MNTWMKQRTRTHVAWLLQAAAVLLEGGKLVQGQAEGTTPYTNRSCFPTWHPLDE
jgi:hypothetical protein